MEIVASGPTTWNDTVTCDKCESVYRGDQGDLQYEGFKTSGYWFDGSATTSHYFFLECPKCGSCHLYKGELEASIPLLVRQKTQAKARRN